MLHRTEHVSERSLKSNNRSVQWPQVRKYVLEDGVCHPVEVSWIKIHLKGRGSDSVKSERNTPYIEGQDAVRGYAQVVQVFGLESGHGGWTRKVN